MDNNAVDLTRQCWTSSWPRVTYVKVKVTEAAANWSGAGGASVGETMILAKDLMKEVLRHNVEVVEEFPGSDLVGRSYEPLFPDAVPRGDSKLHGLYYPQTG